MKPQEARDVSPDNSCEPYHTAEFTELRGGWGWNCFSEHVVHSSGNALVLVHPFYTAALKGLPGLVKDAKIEHRERQRRYITHVVHVLGRAQEQHIPVVVYLNCPEADYAASDHGLRTHDRIKRGIHEVQAFFQRAHIRLKEPLYYVPTVMFDPCPLDTQRITDFHKLRIIFAEQLSSAGLRYAVVGGSMFGGYQFGPKFPYADDTSVNIAKYIQTERHDDIDYLSLSSRWRHPLGCIGAYECVPKVMDSFTFAGIRFRVGRGITYPQLMPKWDELQAEAHGYRWKPGTGYYIQGLM